MNPVQTKRKLLIVGIVCGLAGVAVTLTFNSKVSAQEIVPHASNIDRKLRSDIDTLINSSMQYCDPIYLPGKSSEYERIKCVRRIFAEESHWTLECFEQTGPGDPIGIPDFLVDPSVADIRKQSCKELRKYFGNGK